VILLTAWLRGFEGTGSVMTRESFYALLKKNFHPDAPDTKFESNLDLGDGVCDACKVTHRLSCKFWPNFLDTDVFLRYGGNCGKNMENVDTFMHFLRMMLQELRTTNRVNSALKDKYWGDLIVPLDRIQSKD
jgi:hypothetical protein